MARAAEDDLSTVEVDTPVTMTVNWATANLAVSAGPVPGVESEGGRRTVVTASGYPAAFEDTV